MRVPDWALDDPAWPLDEPSPADLVPDRYPLRPTVEQAALIDEVFATAFPSSVVSPGARAGRAGSASR